MSEEQSLVHIDADLAKPATVLIEKISAAVGGLFEPWQIKRVAKADATAAVIQAEAEIEITDLHRRAIRRFVNEEAQKQENMEAIAEGALLLLEEGAKPDQMEDDWITDFFDKSRLISDSEMRILWSRLLAGQANAPGSYGKRTVDLLASMDRGDAELFTRFCTFGWTLGGEYVPLVLDLKADIYKRHGIRFSDLKHLDSIQLVQFDSLVGHNVTVDGQQILVAYAGQSAILEMPNEDRNVLEIGHALLTRSGAELRNICTPTADPEFREYTFARWREKGYVIYEGRQAEGGRVDPA